MYKTVRKLLRSIKILNIDQINILNNTTVMQQISTKTAPSVFLSNSKNLHIFIQLDFLTLVILSQLTKLIHLSIRLQLEDSISVMNF